MKPTDRLQGKDFIESIKQIKMEKGEYSQFHIPQNQAPTTRVIQDYHDAAVDWIGRYRADLDWGRKNYLEKLSKKYRRIALPLLAGIVENRIGAHSKGSQLPDFTRFKKIHKISNPYHVPDIGGKDGVLTHLIRSIPIGNGTCYKNATLISSAIPGVKAVFGFYPLYGSITRRSHKGLSSREQMSVVKTQLERDRHTALTLSRHKSIGNGWFYGPMSRGSSKDIIYQDKQGTLWTMHAWCSYKGIHFDPYLYSIEKRYGTGRDAWYSQKNGKYITWYDYRMMQETDISALTEKQLLSELKPNKPISEDIRKDIFIRYLSSMMEHCYNLILEHSEVVMRNRHNFGSLAFPVKIPSKRKWIKDKLLYPPGLFSK